MCLPANLHLKSDAACGAVPLSSVMAALGSLPLLLLLSDTHQSPEAAPEITSEVSTSAADLFAVCIPFQFKLLNVELSTQV